MTEPTFRSDMTVQLVKSNVSDEDVVWAARVSTSDGRADEEEVAPARKEGLINFLLRERHGTPFEHGSMTFFIQAPIFVFREFHRHRVGWSYNEESGRYKQLDPVFYVPNEDRPLKQIGKTGAYEFVPGDDLQVGMVARLMRNNSEQAYARYQQMLDAGIAREVSRMVLPVNIMSSMYATCNSRSLMSFLSLRTKSDDSFFKSYPQLEIEMVAKAMEEEFARVMPLTHEAFVKHGRVSP